MHEHIWAWALLLGLRITTCLGRPEGIRPSGDEKISPLLPFPNADTSQLKHGTTFHQRYERNSDSGLASGFSGSGEITTIEVPTFTVIITLPGIPFSSNNKSDHISNIFSLLQKFLSESDAMGKKLSEKYEIHLSVDTEKSSDQVTVLRVYIADADTGAPNPNMTVWFYEKLTSNLNQLREELEKIEIYEFHIQLSNGENSTAGTTVPDSTESQLTSTSLRWWDILFITLGCLAVAVGTSLVILAVSVFQGCRNDAIAPILASPPLVFLRLISYIARLYLRMRGMFGARAIRTYVRTSGKHENALTSVRLRSLWVYQRPDCSGFRGVLRLSHFRCMGRPVARFQCTMARICEAFTCCLRWFSGRREEEEKEGLLTRGDDARNGQQHQPTSTGLRERLVDHDLERREHVRRVARVGFQPRVQVGSHPLAPVELENILKNPATLHSEYSSIPSNLVTMADVPPGAEEKNRYKDILPNPQTRVSLFLKFAVSNSDYINANYIRGYRDAGRAYIATQGPLPWTVDDFWRMIWEQKTSVVVMVTGLEERRIVKCCQYWPDSQVAHTASYGDLDVTLRKRVTSDPNYTVSHFHVRHREKLVSRDITHFWFTAWPDHGVPASPQPALDFLTHIRQYTQDIPAPIVVHCSAGIGRTGVFIGADIGMYQLESEGEVDLLKIVSTMRQDRGGMVQTENQYIFLHQLMVTYAHQLKATSGSGRTLPPPASAPGTTDTSAPPPATDLVLQNNFTDVI